MAVNIGALIPSIAGLATTVGGAIPGLKKPKRTDAGSRAAAKAATQLASAAVGGAQAGQGASRGLALREGLRAASKVAGSASAEVAQAAARDEQRFQDQMTARNERLAQFTRGVGEGAAQFGQAFIQPEGDVAGTQGALEQQPEFRDADTGLGTPAAGGTTDQAFVEPGQQELAETLPPIEEIDLADIEQEIADDAAGATAEFEAQIDEDLGISPVAQKAAIEQGLELKLQMKNLMMLEAERQGIPLSNLQAKINRGLGLQPGQTTGNPFGVSLMDEEQ